LIIGVSKSIDKYEVLAQESKSDIVEIIKKDSISNNKKSKKKEKLTQEKIDSIKQDLDNDLNNAYIPASVRKKIIDEVEKEAKDTLKTKKDKDNVNISFGGDTRLDEFSDYIKDYPDSKIDDALDSLKYEKNFTNRFLYTKAKTLRSVIKNEDNREQYFSQVLSYGSIALFIFLPFFTLFLKFFYIRGRFTYVDHLIFVFHVQTVFFMLFTIFVLLKIFGLNPAIWVFVILFLIYLLIAMKKFYKQGYFKTFLKFLLLNLSYFIVSSVGVIFLLLISFALF
jgi:hypothetical protein